MDAKTRLLYWLLDATKGGPTRVRILRAISGKPMNLRKLALAVGMDYKTVQGHTKLLIENGIIYTPKMGYGSVYFISPEWEGNEYLKEVLGGSKNEGEGKRKGKRKRK